MSIGTELLYKLCEFQKNSYFTNLNPKWFIDIEKDMYDYIKKFHTKYNKVPSLKTFSKKFGEPIFVDEPFEYYAEEFRKFVIMKEVKERIRDINLLIDNDDKVDELIKQLNKIVDTANELNTTLDTNIKEITDLFVDVKNMFLDRISEGVGIPTGWETLDEATGGLQRGNIFIVLARVKMGKTAILIKMMNTALEEGLKVMMISMEMTSREIGLRLFCMRNNLNMKILQKKEPSSFVLKMLDDDIKRLKGKLFLKYIDGQFKKNIEGIIAAIQTYKPDVVYIDGGYLIKNVSFNKSKWEDVSDVIERLKTIAMLEDIPIVVSYQFNRQVGRKAETVKDTAFEKVGLSDAISQIASTGIAILNVEGEEDKRLIEIIGGRGGEKGSFIINWDWERMNFNEEVY